MTKPPPFTRRKLLTGVATATPALLLGCDRLGNAPNFRASVLSTGEWLSYRVQRLIGGNRLAREYTQADLSPDFRTNGTNDPDTDAYRHFAESRFANWKLQVGGAVAQPRSFSLAELRAMPARTQITRHDCVEGWSAIGGWTGVQLGYVLDAVQLKPEVRYIVFRCADSFGRLSPTPYYESIDLNDAFHPQTILAYDMNGTDLPIGHGAPLRLRVERQLGYKHAKYIMQIEAVSSLAGIGQGKGGYWEDVGFYEWYAGV